MDRPKDPEPTSRSGYSEAARSRTLSSDERALFDELFKALDSLVLERSPAEPAFLPIHEVPEWALCVITRVSDQPSQDLWDVSSHFLKNYVSRAMPWWDQHEGGELPSEPWEEDGPSEGVLDLETTATAIGPRKLLVIKRGAPSRRAYIQLMREKKLNLRHQPSES